MKNIFLIVCALVLSSCETYATKKEFLHAYEANKQEIASPLNYQESYKIISDKMKECHRFSIYGAQYSVSTKMDNQNQVGEIEFYVDRIIGSRIFLSLIRTTPASKGSMITVYEKEPIKSLGAEGMTGRVKQWLAGDGPCLL